jgi:hypothetical protein
VLLDGLEPAAAVVVCVHLLVVSASLERKIVGDDGERAGVRVGVGRRIGAVLVGLPPEFDGSIWGRFGLGSIVGTHPPVAGRVRALGNTALAVHHRRVRHRDVCAECVPSRSRAGAAKHPIFFKSREFDRDWYRRRDQAPGNETKKRFETRRFKFVFSHTFLQDRAIGPYNAGTLTPPTYTSKHKSPCLRPVLSRVPS